MPALPRQDAPGLSASSLAPSEAGGEYRPSLAVLPFHTLQRDQADAYFAEGMVDDIIRALGGLKDLVVISRSSTIGFARLPLDVRRVGQELDVLYVLHDSVRRSGGALRIAVELSEAQTGGVIWADRFDGQLADLFDLQDRIALRVATAIASQLREREPGRALRKHPESMTAYDLTPNNFPNYRETKFELCIAVEGDDVDLPSWFDGLPQLLPGARRIRMFDMLQRPARTAFISMPRELDTASVHIRYGSFWG